MAATTLGEGALGRVSNFTEHEAASKLLSPVSCIDSRHQASEMITVLLIPFSSFPAREAFRSLSLIKSEVGLTTSTYAQPDASLS